MNKIRQIKAAQTSRISFAGILSYKIIIRDRRDTLLKYVTKNIDKNNRPRSHNKTLKKPVFL